MTCVFLKHPVVHYDILANDSYSSVSTVLIFEVFILSSCLQNALDLMRVIPKKANDMMNVGMLEGYCVRITLDHCMKHKMFTIGLCSCELG